jgi:uncharacterized protein (TIGR03437 family)
MSRFGTIRKFYGLPAQLLAVAFLAGIASGQTNVNWRKLGNSSIGLNLAGPATGPVSSVWFSPSGDRLYAKTKSGQVMETSDFGTWTVSRNSPPAPENDPGNRIQLGGRLYALGTNLQVSDDGGNSWIDLTGYNGVPVIGSNQHSIAISPLDSRQIVVANDYGVWRSTDGGLSWAGLNEDLANLPIRRLLPSQSGGPVRAEMEGIGPAELAPAAAVAHTNWVPSAGGSNDETDLRLAAGKALNARITAFARSASAWYAGASDGRLWTSKDEGATWDLSRTRAAGPIEAIQVAADAPHTAVAAASASSGIRILRTTNDGGFWDDLAGNLPDAALHGVALDVAAGVIYVAGDRGVFLAHTDLTAPGPVPSWQRLAGLPEARAMDVRLDRDRNQLYAALDGYGLYAANVPRRSAAVRIMNAAEQPAQATAPGGLLHVEGNQLSSVKSNSGDLALVSRSDASVQVQVPFEVSGSALPISVISSRGQSDFSLPLQETAPAILVDGDGMPIVVDSASGLTLDARNIAKPGSRIQIFAAGLGKVTPDWRAGVPAPDDPPSVVAKVEVWLGGTPVEVTRATLAPGYVGLYLVEVQLPGLVNSGPAELWLVVNGAASNHVRILLGSES